VESRQHERDLTLQMTLKNLGPAANVELGRVTDVNVDFSLDKFSIDLFDRTRNALWFRDPVNGGRCDDEAADTESELLRRCCRSY